MDLSGKRLILGLTGGVACYKAADLCRALVKEGATVQVVMTEAASHFITAVTMQALSGHPVYESQWDARVKNGMAHINLTREVDAIVIAPCSADFMAKLVHGSADDLLSVLCLARPRDRVPLLLAPAMNREMWTHPATQRNVAQLAADGCNVLGVVMGAQACGETGEGRMLEPADVLQDVVAFFQPKILTGQRVLITAGPTFEAIDPVRGITNLSSGKMGFALARAAYEAGAQVELIAGPVSLSTPRGILRRDVCSASEMLKLVMEHAHAATVFIAAAAVTDWRSLNVAREKIKKDSADGVPDIRLVENTDILASVAQSSRGQDGALYCVGFAAESQDLLSNTSVKRRRKNVPLMVGNLGPATFGKNENELLLVDAHGVKHMPRDTKLVLARQLIAEIAQRLPGSSSSTVL